MTESLGHAPGTPASRRHAAIDLLRGGSILYIVGFWHLLGYVDGIDGYKNAVTYRLTVVVLGLFTLMAGALAGRREIRTGGHIWRYYRARFLRIVPPYWAALAIFGLVELLKWPDVVKGVLLIPAFNGDPLRTLWYVNMLVLFYAAAPLLLILRHSLIVRTGSRAQAQVVLCGSLALGLGALDRLLGGLDPRILLYFPAFAVGLLLSGELLGHADARGPLHSRGLALLTALVLVALTISLGVQGRAIETSLRSLPMAALVPALLVVVTCRRLRGWSLPGWLQATSTASFFMYLLHRPLLKGLKAAAAGLEPAHPWWLLLVLLVVGVPLIAGLSWWGQRLYDRALRAMGW